MKGTHPGVGHLEKWESDTIYAQPCSTVQYREGLVTQADSGTRPSWTSEITIYVHSLQYNTFSHHWQGSIDFNTVRTSRPTGMYFLVHP